MQLQINKKQNATVIQVCAPIAAANEEEIEICYAQINQTLNKNLKNENDCVIVMGDFNSLIGNREKGEKNIMENCRYSKRNDRGEYMVNFCRQNNLKIFLVIFKKIHNIRKREN